MYRYERRKPNLLPNLPDVVMRQIFNMLNYKELCAVEAVCRRWQSIMQHLMRRDIHEITFERLGSCRPAAKQIKAFRRLNVQCPTTSYDFLSGVLRRSRLSAMRMTADLEFLANIQKIHVNKEERRKYFSNCEDLWMLIINCNDEVLERYQSIHDMLFNELQQLTLQVHLNTKFKENVGKLVSLFIKTHPKATINLELHADKSSMIFDQLLLLPSLPLNKIKIICTDFDLPQLRLDGLYTAMKERGIVAKNVTIRDWSLFADGTTPVYHLPLDTYRISSCTIETVDNLVKSLHMTASQERPKPKKRIVKRKKVPEDENAEDGDKPKKKVVKKVVKKKKPPPFIQKLEIAGQCTLLGLQFLQNQAHTELERKLAAALPEMEVDCSDIYYCF